MAVPISRPKEDIASFLKAASSDPSLGQLLQSSGSADAVLAAINKAGFSITNTDLEELAGSLNSETQELDDAALAGVSGGFFGSAVDKLLGGKVAIGQTFDDAAGMFIDQFFPKFSEAYKALDKAF